LVAKIYELIERENRTWDSAAEKVYSENALPVNNTENFCKYMMVGNPGKNEAPNSHFLVTFNFSAHGLVSIDNDENNNRVAWGDDIVLEALATVYQRDVFVVLVGAGQMFFLPHRPRKLSQENEKSGCEVRLPPWFLLMRLTGSGRGGDHYEPMVCRPQCGTAAEILGSIGE